MNILLELKKEYKTATGKDYQPPNINRQSNKSVSNLRTKSDTFLF